MATVGSAQIVLDEEDRRRLERIRSGPQSLTKHVWRAAIILHLGDGCGLAKDNEGHRHVDADGLALAESLP